MSAGPHGVRRPRSRRLDVDRVLAGSLLVLAAASLLLTTWLGFRSWDALLRALSRPLALQQWQALLTGLLSSHLMVLMVVLLARLPWLERAWGRRRLTRWHRWLAQASFWLMVLHVLLFVLQRSVREPRSVGGAMLDLFVREDQMLLASIGTGLVVLVTATSIARARRRLRYETWHLVHLWAYLGMGLALPHQLVSVDFASLWTRVYWWTLYLGALGAVLVFRVALPLVRSLRLGLRVVEVVPETPGIVSVVVTGRGLHRLRLRAGEFLVWRFLGGRGRTRGHPYSVSRAPDGASLRVTVGGDGDGARRVADLEIGSRVLVEGPYGALGSLRRRHPHLLLVAAGVGVTPLRALLEQAALDGAGGAGGVTLLQRASSEEDVLFLGEVDDLALASGIEVVRLVGPRRTPWSMFPEGVQGEAPTALLALAPDLLASDVVVCGPPAWAAAVQRVATAAGVRRRDLHREDFGW